MTQKKHGKSTKPIKNKNKNNLKENANIDNSQQSEVLNYELSSAYNFINQSGSGSSLYDIKLEDLYKYLRNPFKYLKQIRLTSKYMSNKYGIIKDVLRALKTLPTLSYHLNWSSNKDLGAITEMQNEVQSFINTINIKQLTRDIIYEVGEVGTVVLCNRKNKYIQFLDLDELKIDKQRNGNWIVEYDLDTLKNGNLNIKDLKEKISSLPDEVTLSAYNLYKSKGSEDYRYIELKNCDVINIDANRNNPYGLPFTFPAWTAILQKELISRVERSVADRLLKQILILTAGNIADKPAPKQLTDPIFKSVTDLILKKEQGTRNSTSDLSGTGVILLHEIFKLESLEIDTTFFPKELYEKINKDIFMDLGVSPGLVYGGDANFSSSSINNEKIFRYIFSILESVENVINKYILKILEDKEITCVFHFNKSSILDKDRQITHAQTFYQQTGIFAPWAESVMGVPMEHAISQARYEKQVLNTEDIIYPPKNAHTQPSGEAGRPETDNPTDNTNKSKTNGGNNLPSPSD